MQTMLFFYLVPLSNCRKCLIIVTVMLLIRKFCLIIKNHACSMVFRRNYGYNVLEMIIILGHISTVYLDTVVIGESFVVM